MKALLDFHTATPRGAAHVIASSAAYDLAVTFPFATPWTARSTLALLAHAHVALALPGAPATLDGPVPLLFANLMGSLVVVWSLVRLRAPVVFLGAADTAGRLLFAAWMAYALAHGASFVLVAFLVLEIGWGLLQGSVVLCAARTGAPSLARG